MANALTQRYAARRPNADAEEDMKQDMLQDQMMMQQQRPWGPGDQPGAPMRGVDGRMYGPGYNADPANGTDSSPAQKLYDNDWLDNVVKLTENGMLHPKVLELLGPQIQAMEKSQKARGKAYDPTDPY